MLSGPSGPVERRYTLQLGWGYYLRSNGRQREDGVAETIDIAIVGGGPAGLTAAIYGARARVKTHVFETAFPGGQIVTASWVENYPGFPDGVSGQELGDRMHRQAEAQGAVFHNLSPVEAICKRGEDFFLTVDGQEVQAHVVILATGAIPKKLGVPGEAEFTGRGVSWCATCDGPLYRDKTVAVVGGGDSATQESLYLAKIAKEVHLIHRREELRATECLQEECFFNPQIVMHLSYTMSEIVGEGGKVAGVKLVSKADGGESLLPVDGVFEFVGVDAQSELVKDLCNLDEAGFVVVDQNGLTSCSGLYAAGDVSIYDLKQVVTAAARGAFAAFHAAHWLETRTVSPS
jgi:thioredoxin reductase (NADPH)